jgi:hypothetical protein
MSSNETIQELVGLLKDIVDNENISIYPSAIEGNHSTDFEQWETKTRDAITRADAPESEEL